MRTMFRVCATERLFIPDIFPSLDKASHLYGSIYYHYASKVGKIGFENLMTLSLKGKRLDTVF
jgi:hypothetical protein